MLTAEGCQRRRRLLWDRVSDTIDWLLLADPMSLIHLANYYADPFVFRTVNAGALLLMHRDGTSILVTDSMVRPFVEKAHVEVKRAPTWYDGVHSAPPRGPFLVANALEVLREKGGSRFGIESAYLPAGVLEGIRSFSSKCEFTPIDSIMRDSRRSKRADEIAVIRQSVKAIEAGFQEGREQIAPGMTELEAFFVMQKASLAAIEDQMPIYGDFGAGPNTLKGGFPTPRKIERGEVFLADFSVVVFGYRADFASAWIVGAKATDDARRWHDACVDALAAGAALLKPGVSGREIDRAVRASFAEKGLEQQFTSHSGHGLGLGHPDPPYFVPDSDDVLVEGDVVAIEPSQKVDGFGCIRCEHNYLITASGAEQLSHHLLAIDALGP